MFPANILALNYLHGNSYQITSTKWNMSSLVEGGYLGPSPRLAVYALLSPISRGCSLNIADTNFKAGETSIGTPVQIQV